MSKDKSRTDIEPGEESQLPVDTKPLIDKRMSRILKADSYTRWAKELGFPGSVGAFLYLFICPTFFPEVCPDNIALSAAGIATFAGIVKGVFSAVRAVLPFRLCSYLTSHATYFLTYKMAGISEEEYKKAVKKLWRKKIADKKD